MNDQPLASKGSIAFDLFAIGTWGAWIVAYVNQHPGDSILWFLGFVLILIRIPTAWLDLRERWRRRG